MPQYQPHASCQVSLSATPVSAALPAGVMLTVYHPCFYSCQIEEGTPFARWYSGGRDGVLPREPEAVEMFGMASHMLTAAGYEHYEVSTAQAA